MTFKTIWQWILSDGWPLSMNKNLAIKYFNENHSESMKTLSHFDLSIHIDEISTTILNLNIHEQLIVIDSDETCSTISFLLGILQSNNAFFFCDSKWNENIIRKLIRKLQPALFICQNKVKKQFYDKILDQTMSTTIILFDQQIDFYRINTNQCSYKDIAYVVASSGSTGIPKLIFVSHECILPNLEQLKIIYDVTMNDCLFRATPLTFDPSFIDIFLAINAGACLCILSNEIRQNPMLIASSFNKSLCTIVQMTPSFFRQINEQCHMNQLKTLILGGEQFPSISNIKIQRMIEDDKRIINIYGLTEMSCWASYYQLNKNDFKRTNGIPLGKALNQTKLVLQPNDDVDTNNNYFQLVLESETRWSKIDEITSEKKFQIQTDDLVRYDDKTDEIVYVGRRTLTLKRFGIMINLEFIEKIVHQSNLIDECACLILEENEQFLILLCKFSNEIQIIELETYLKSQLTHHFIPNLIVPLNKTIPLSVNGKIDRKNLYSFYLNTIDDSSNSNLITIWQNLLNKSPKLNSNFITDGGNSLLTLTLIEHIKRNHQSIDTNYLFDLILHRTFQNLIEYICCKIDKRTITTQLISTNFPIVSSENNHITSIWSIQRCSKIYFHNQNQLMLQYSSFPYELPLSSEKFMFHWKSSMNKCIDASPVIVLLDENRQYVIVGSHSGLINAYQITDGQLIWSYQANDRIEASGTISRNGQFFLIGDYSGILYIIDCSNGKLYSTYQCQDLIKTIPCIHPFDDRVYIGSHDQFLHAVHIEENSSKCIWKCSLKSSCFSSPQLSNDHKRLYVATLNGDIFAFESNDGTMIWNRSLMKPLFSTMTLWKDKFLFIGSVDNKLYCLNCDDGQQKSVFATMGSIFSSPCIFDNTLFIGCHDQYLYAIRLSDENEHVLLWKCLFPSMIYASPFVFNHGQMVIVGSTNGCLRLLDTRNGNILCETQLNEKGLFSSPICYLNFVIVGSRDDNLYCFQL